MVIALDVDGTLYDGDRVATEARAALHTAHQAGHTLLIVTGRKWEDLDHILGPDLSLFSKVVCEEGTVVVDVTTRHVTELAEPVSPHLVAALEDAGIRSLDVGHVVIGAHRDAEPIVLEVLQRLGIDRHVSINKASITLVPRGYDKGVGLRGALAALGLVDAPVLAIGDAANDMPMFAVASIAIGVANADDTVRAGGIALTDAPYGLGVAEAIQRFALHDTEGTERSTDAPGATGEPPVRR